MTFAIVIAATSAGQFGELELFCFLFIHEPAPRTLSVDRILDSYCAAFNTYRYTAVQIRMEIQSTFIRNRNE